MIDVTAYCTLYVLVGRKSKNCIGALAICLLNCIKYLSYVG